MSKELTTSYRLYLNPYHCGDGFVSCCNATIKMVRLPVDFTDEQVVAWVNEHFPEQDYEGCIVQRVKGCKFVMGLKMSNHDPNGLVYSAIARYGNILMDRDKEARMKRYASYKADRDAGYWMGNPMW